MRLRRVALTELRAEPARPRRALLAASLMVSLGSACAIHPKGGAAETTPSTQNATDPFRPVQLRIHPLTRLIPASEDHPPAIETHIELLDRWGHPVKALGELRLELRFDADAAPARRWKVDLRNPEVNAAERYDVSTRTYRLRLVDAPESLTPESRATIRAAFRTLDDRTLTDTFRLDR